MNGTEGPVYRPAAVWSSQLKIASVLTTIDPHIKKVALDKNF